MKDTLVIIGASLNLLSVVPYIIDVIRRKTRPNIVSWLTWTILTSIGAAAVFVGSGFAASLLPLSSSLSTLSIVLLGFKYGFSKYSRFDLVCQFSAIGGLLLWYIFNTPVVALVSVVVIDAIAALPTLRHALLRPKEETWQTFAVASFASLVSIIGLKTYTVSSSLYPFYLCIMNGIIASTILYGRGRVHITEG
jgi:uncharacterized paraquat-inducible protein A